MTNQEYGVFARLFDAVWEANEVDGRIGIQLHGAVAGDALQAWACQHGHAVSVEPRSVESIGDWTALVVTLPKGAFADITVHLDNKQAADEQPRTT